MNRILFFRENPSGTGTEEFYEYRLDGLRPATAYALRLAAINAIGDSDYSEPVIVQTLEEGKQNHPDNLKIIVSRIYLANLSHCGAQLTLFFSSCRTTTQRPSPSHCSRRTACEMAGEELYG